MSARRGRLDRLLAKALGISTDAVRPLLAQGRVMVDGRVAQTREEIVEIVWQESLGSGVSEQAIDALVRRLRERLSEHGPGVTFIETVRGLGFRLKAIS